MNELCEECSYVRYMMDALTGEKTLYCQLQDEGVTFEFITELAPDFCPARWVNNQ